MSFIITNVLPKVFSIRITRVIKAKDMPRKRVDWSVLILIVRSGSSWALLCILSWGETARRGVLSKAWSSIIAEVSIIEYGIADNVEQIIEHAREKTPQELAALLKARVCIDLNKHGAELLIQDEIEAQQFKGVLLLTQFSFYGFDGILYNLYHASFEMIK